MISLEQTIVEIISEKIAGIVISQLNFDIDTPDQLLNKKELAKKLKCDPSVVDEKYINKSGFPKMIAGENSQMRFSDKAVDKWIAENQIYTK